MGLVRQGVPFPLVLNVPPGATNDVVLNIPFPGEITANSLFTSSLNAQGGSAILDLLGASGQDATDIMDREGFFSPNAILGASLTPVSGTTYQNTNVSPNPGFGTTVYIPATYLLAFENTGTLTGTIQLALGSTTPPGDFGPAFTVGADQTIVVPLRVPPLWYWSVTQSGSLAPEILAASVLLGA